MDPDGVRYEPAIVRRSRIEQGRASFMAMSQWEGAVVERFGSYFRAEVIDLRTNETATVDFDLDEVSPADLKLCEPGALFYWAIGYETRQSGQRYRTSVLLFRRVGVTEASRLEA